MCPETEKSTQRAIATGQGSPRSAAHIILIVTRHAQVSESVMQYTLDVADRLGYNLLVAYVNTLPFLLDGGRRSQLMKSAAKDNISDFRRMAAEKNIQISSVMESGKISKVIHRLCHIVRKIEFVVIDKDIKIDEAASRAPVPVFNVYCGDHISSRTLSTKKRAASPAIPSYNSGRSTQNWRKSVFFGGLLLCLYALLFYNIDQVMNYWTKGGAYAIFPVMTAVVFFFVQDTLIQTCVSTFKRNKQHAYTYRTNLCSPSIQMDNQPVTEVNRKQKADPKSDLNQ